jgi:predicted nucleic acid-binding protein
MRPQSIGKSIYSRAVVIDTGALLALANSADIHHTEGDECLGAIAELRLPLYLSVPTIYETHRRMLFDLGQVAANRFLESVYDGTINILRTEDQDEQAGRALMDRHAALKLTLTDAVNMAIMSRVGIGAAFSFDRHFLQAGFIRVPPLHLST